MVCSHRSAAVKNKYKHAPPATNLDLAYSFVDPTTLKNAGHMWSITNTLNNNRSQKFTYDQLNRITSAGTTATTGTSCWGYQYSYDAWGNLLSQAGWTPTYSACSETMMAPVTADTANRISGLTYDTSGNALTDGANTYTWNGNSELKTAAGVTYLYDGDGNRVSKSSGTLYWYGLNGEVLDETDATGNVTNTYYYFNGKRVAARNASSTFLYYAEDYLGSSRVIVQQGTGLCYDADFTPFGGERTFTNTCSQRYKFEGKERDTETGNDDFGARYYSNRIGRWLSSDWSAVPVAVPYANLANPQTLNLYAMVADDPESFADLDGHDDADVLRLIALGDTIAPEAAPIITGAGLGYLAAEAIWNNRNAIGRALETSLGGGGGFGGQYGDFSRQLSLPTAKSNTNQSGSPQTQASQQGQSTPAQPPQQPGGPEQKDRYTNPGHHDTNSPKYLSGKSPLPGDAESAYAGAVKDTGRASGTSTTYYAKTADGKYYRYQGQSGEVHWNGEVKANKVPKNIRTTLDAPQ